jgi:uncharacterized coiled-coil DUF342 family protein
MKNLSSFKTKYLVAIALFGLFSAPFSLFVKNVRANEVVVNYQVAQAGIGATLQEQLAQLEKELKEIKSQKSSIQSKLDSNSYTIAGYNSQISKLYGEAELYQKDIDQLAVEIKQIEISIDILNQQITEKETEIARSENTMVDLEKESNLRIKNSYFNFRMYGNNEVGSNVLPVTNINEYFKDSQYKELIQSDTNDLFALVVELKEELAAKKLELDSQLTSVKKDKEILDIKKSDLDKKKEEVDIKIAAYYSQVNALKSQNNQFVGQIKAFSEDEIKKKAESNKIQQQILNSYVPASQGQYVVAGTIIGNKGSTGFSTGPHLHFMVYQNGATQNPCGYLSGGVCGGNNILQWPLQGDVSLTSGYGNRCFQYGSNPNYCDFHSGIDLVSSPWNAPVYSAHNGYVNKGVDGYGALYIVLCEAPNCSGMKTGYWHLSRY